ncbi:hypothetical protein OB905_13410 [Halobacteria archaeon AArc-dxtr1]|nr:hypothetical protein [Halobacteria archaeon AArc-dxtr1]
MAPEILVESVSLLLYTILAALLTAGGLIVEYASVQYFATGEGAVALWLAAMGAIMLYAGVYAMGYQKVLRTVHSR